MWWAFSIYLWSRWIMIWLPFFSVFLPVWTVTNFLTSFPNNHPHQDKISFFQKKKLSHKRVSRTFILPVLKQWPRNNFSKNIWQFSERNLNFKSYNTFWRDVSLPVPLMEWVLRLPNHPTNPIGETVFKALVCASYFTRCFACTIDLIFKITQLGSYYFHPEDEKTGL